MPQDNKTETGAFERRAFQMEFRADQKDGKKTIAGMAAVYNKYTNMGYYLEVVRPGFFEGIDTSMTACLKNHNENLILGRTSNNTLALEFKADGLSYQAVLPDTTAANDTHIEIEGGYISQSSFGFTVKKATWSEVQRSEFSGIVPEDVLDRLSYGGFVDVRELVQGAALYDVSPVTFPAYQDTSSEVVKRSWEAFKAEKRTTQEQKEQDEKNNEKTEKEQTTDESAQPGESDADLNLINMRLQIAIAEASAIH